MHRWYTHQPPARAERLALAQQAFALTLPDAAGGQLHLRIQRELPADLLENAWIDDFDRELDAYERTAARLTSPRDIYWATALRATQQTLHGDLPSAEQHARGAALRGGELDQDATGAYMLQKFVIRYQQGRLSEERERHEMLAEYALASAYRAGAALAALAAAETRRYDDAVNYVWQVLGQDGSALAPDAFWLAAVAMSAAAVAPTNRDPELVALLAELLAPCAEHVVVFGTGGAVLGSGHHWLGQLALARDEPGLALEHLRRAVEIAEECAAPYWVAHAEIDTATALERRGGRTDRREASSLRRRAVDVAVRRGYGRLRGSS